MSKFFMKLCALTLVLLGVCLFFSSGSKVFAAVNCPANQYAPNNWGTNDIDGPMDHGFSAVAVHAYYQDVRGNFVDLNVKYHLNSSADHAGNPSYGPPPPGVPAGLYPDARIFQEPIPGGGRTDSRWFGTGGASGDQLYSAPGSPGTCNGWDELGVGTANAIGNHFLLDCQEYDTNGNVHNNRFWIDQISTPQGPISQNGGHWKIEISTGGGPLQDRGSPPMSYNNYFAVINGENARVNLEWIPNPPPQPKPETAACTNTTIYDDGGHSGNHTYTEVTIRGTNNDQTNYHIPYNGSHTFGYRAISGTITIERNRFENRGSPSSPNWQSYSDTIQRIDCYHATCYPGQVIDGNGPNGEVYANQQFTLAIPFWNDNGSPDAEPIPASVGGYNFSLTEPPENGHGFIENDVGYSVNPGTAPSDVAYVYVRVTAPSTLQNLTLNFYPDMYNYGPLGGGPGGSQFCTTTVPIFQHFSASLSALSTLSPTDENPDTATYSTTVNVSPPSPSVHIPTRSTFKKTGGSNIASNSGGDYPPATAFSGSYAIPPGFKAGDQYCAHIDADYTDGYVGPGGAIAGASGPASADSCDKVTNKPYFKAYGGNISAGGDFSQTGSCSGGGLLAGWNNNTNGVDRGAGSELSALALIKITGFASAQTAITRNPTDLTFANTIASDITTDNESPNLGGNFDPTGNHCLPDVKPNDNTTVYSGNYTQPGKTNINDQESIFVNGDVLISGDIAYTNSWALDNTPSFVLHATGNIYIDPGVKQLDGLYISNKKIYTCGNGFTPMPASSMFSGCNNQLVINGSLVAQQINFMRTFGSLRDEEPSGGSPAVPAVPPTPGATVPLNWSSSGRINGQNCTNINEPSNRSNNRKWNNNYLCVPAGNGGLQIGWTNGGGTSSLRSRGFTYCTAAWSSNSRQFGPEWNDNYLCSNSPVSLVTAPISGQSCTTITEPSDARWRTAYVCIPPGSPGSPAIPAVPPSAPAAPACSNKGIQVVASTCAAEIINFTPEFFLSKPAIRPPNGGTTPYDAITSLPPVL